MKTVTYYECEICGFTSISSEKVESCEKQGRPNKFKEGDEIVVTIQAGEFGTTPGEIFSLSGRVCEIFWRVDHTPEYLIEFYKEPPLLRLWERGRVELGCVPPVVRFLENKMSRRT